MSEPAIGLIEFDSISAGIVAGDAMVKASPVSAVLAGTVHPGKYLVLVGGDTASVEVSMDVGSESASDHVTDTVFLPDIHPSVVEAIETGFNRASLTREAIGIVECGSVAAAIDSADAGVKAANVTLAGLSLADDLGGKAYLILSGEVAEVEHGVDAAVVRCREHDALVRSDVIAQLHEEMAENLAANLRFMKRVTAKA